MSRRNAHLPVLGYLLMMLALLSPTLAVGQSIPGGNLDANVVWTWGPTAAQYPLFTDVWSAPTVARIFDTNGDGIVDQSDDPSIIFVSGNDINNPLTGVGTNCPGAGGNPTACHRGALRVLNGRTGVEQFSLDRTSAFSVGFAGISVAVGDVIGNGTVQIAAVTGEGYVVLIGPSSGPMGPTLAVLRTSDKPIPGNGGGEFGWGGGLAIADMDGDGFPEIAYDATVFSTRNGAIILQWSGTIPGSPSSSMALSTMANLNAGGGLQLLDGNAAYNADGTVLWSRASLPAGFDAVADFDGDGSPDVVLVGNGKLWILNGATGATELGPATLPGTSGGLLVIAGGPPVIADFDGDGKPEIGVANGAAYSVLKPDFANQQLNVLWQNPTSDPFSSVTGSIAFDFDGNGRASVVYSDGCFLWVFDGATGAVRYATSHTSFTGTEEPIVADVNGDGKAEIVMVSNGVDPAVWGCLDAAGMPVQVNGVTWQPGIGPGHAYRGVTVFGSGPGGWAKAPALWNEHTFHVSNISDGANGLYPTLAYGAIPRSEVPSWSAPWLNNFRQNVQRQITATSTTLSVSANPAIVNQPTTFTATVSPVSGMGTPTGSVRFKDGTTTIGNQPLIGGQAALTVSNLIVGAHLISAVYSGDSAFGESSVVLSEQIQGASCIGSNPVPCTASDPCHVAGVCDQQTGICSNPVAADGTVCNDGNACTQGDVCHGGTCVGGNAVVCTASDLCHVSGICDPHSGICSNPPTVDGTRCDDGLFCNGDDACFGGTCTHFGNPCLKGGVCDPRNGTCVGCLVGSDCNSGICSGGACASACPTGQVNCGGVCRDTSTDAANCGACGIVCPASNSCISGQCQVASSCVDHVKNGSETDVDCGGGACSACATGRACIVSSDCQSHVCTGNLCVGTALLRVHYPAGGHAVTVRGSAGGLSWTLGQPTAASGDTFTYALVGLTAPAEWKPLLDDATWSRGPNYHVAPGETVDVWPHFTSTLGRVVTLIPAFHSTVLGNDRAIYAYLPASYDENTDATYPVVYMHDGQNLWAALPQLAFGATWNVDTAFDVAAETGTCSAGGVVGWGAQPLGGVPVTCISDGDCLSGECRTFPEAIVIGVANNPNRIYEYTPTTDPGTPGGGGAGGYVQMLAGELKPTIDAVLRTRPGVGSTAIAGSSLGGLVSAYAALQRPDVYGLVAELSPATWWNGDVIVSEVAGTLPAPARPQIVYVDSGAGAADTQADTDLLAAQYLALGYVDGVSFRHVVQPGALHNEVYWAERFPGAMQLLLGVRGQASSSCTDAVRNGSETGVDCGGGVCPACDPGNACLVNADCQSRACISGVCRVAATCNDGGQDGNETDVDCGGDCPVCVIGKGCLVGSDCVSGICSGGVCASSCPTGQVNCGGVCRNTSTDRANCGACGYVCPAGDSCFSGQCQVASTCTDGVKDGTETGIDCGGACPACPIPGCLTDADCGDLNPCTTDTCVAHACVHAPVVCVAQDQCHDAGTCDLTGLCSNPARPDGTRCSDGNACTQSDTCQAGACVGSNLVTCTAFDQCHAVGVCNTSTGVCSAPAKSDGSACNDGNACTHADSCQVGACVGASPVTCVALDQCHDAGVCNTGTGICSNPTRTNGAACSDGNACTQTDTCQAGVCQGTNYSWSGLLQPVNADGSSIFKLGSTVPVKFQLTGACAGITNASAHLMLAQYSNDVLGTDVEATSTSAADTGNTFRYDGQQYVFNLASKSLSKGTWLLRINLGDGVPNRTIQISFK